MRRQVFVIAEASARQALIDGGDACFEIGKRSQIGALRDTCRDLLERDADRMQVAFGSGIGLEVVKTLAKGFDLAPDPLSFGAKSSLRLNPGADVGKGRKHSAIQFADLALQADVDFAPHGVDAFGKFRKLRLHRRWKILAGRRFKSRHAG